MLQQFGFTNYESQVYEALIAVESPLDASTIVKYSSVPRAKVYEVLNRLTEKGVVLESTLEKKRVYSALPLESMIKKLEANFSRNVEQLRSIQIAKKQQDDRVWTLKDEDSISSLVHTMIRKATTSIKFSSWSEDIETHLPALEELQRQGLEIELHSIGHLESTIDHVTVLLPIDQHSNLEQSRMVIIDDEEMLFAAMEDGDWQALHSYSRPLVKFFTEFFYHDVALTEITSKHREDVMKDENIRSILMKLKL
ncbi:TrmB family transcriptional regulator [Pontibacillus halophilus JSM 076056 = DSM 19796]|uniref:TrmB family transcriptional regulator n=1 Tax=Pontibacillus halophilus JSM 076056 = DSM 19796 TaxID=1385510 RepID=A0A0A5GEY0_9BACI|nr:helix-turn-helix domain-containing protein [Pontibacillus halophilus]KGX90514.1 TrmB family transcriptional regulator [Pontibacillus halophilus JSM 076056 = DSM 19796]